VRFAVLPKQGRTAAAARVVGGRRMMTTNDDDDKEEEEEEEVTLVANDVQHSRSPAGSSFAATTTVARYTSYLDGRNEKYGGPNRLFIHTLTKQT
jgi:hypothetical protein